MLCCGPTEHPDAPQLEELLRRAAGVYTGATAAILLSSAGTVLCVPILHICPCAFKVI